MRRCSRKQRLSLRRLLSRAAPPSWPAVWPAALGPGQVPVWPGSVSGEGSADLNGELTVTVPDIKLDASNQVTAARNDLSSSLNDISDRVRSLTNSTGSNAQNLIDDLRAVADQMEQIGRTIAGAMDEKTTDDIYQDISDDDTVKDTEGKVLNCVNYGDVQADLNAGGITGAMARENDLDPEDDIQVVGSDSLNFTYKTRVVLRQCVNYGTVSAKKQNAGGIVGNMEMGTVLDVLNLGTMDAEDAANVGGVAGKSSAPIRQSSAKCRLTGKSQVGGIAGTGKEIIDCRSLVVVDACDEARGAIAGTVADDSTLERNYFVSDSPGRCGRRELCRPGRTHEFQRLCAAGKPAGRFPQHDGDLPRGRKDCAHLLAELRG